MNSRRREIGVDALGRHRVFFKMNRLEANTTLKLWETSIPKRRGRVSAVPLLHILLLQSLQIAANVVNH